MLMILDPKFSADITREAMRCLKAIRAFELLNAYLPVKTPRPANVALGQRPYLLEITWKRESRSMVMGLRASLNRILNVPNKWYVDRDDENEAIVNYTQISVGEKDSVKVILRIEMESDDDEMV